MWNEKKAAKVVAQWSYATISRVPRAIVGVYAFWCRDNGKCIYVGQASDRPIRDRLREHWRGSHNETLKLWIQAFGENLDVCYTPTVRDKIDTYERRLIKAWKPEANKQHNR